MFCKDCGIDLGPGDGRRKRCKPCSDTYFNPPRKRRPKWHRGSPYGLTSEQLEAMYLAQDFRCKVCGRLEGKRKLSIDHDHSCCPQGGSCGKCVRGLVCNQCNVAIGLMADDPETLRKAADYLESYKGS